ncbi:hypothetical protein MPOR_19740 [Mycolicibacterium poriferae]|uniref:Uncharacterized protein n=1 Tax=Mycolicibacterium poriferae TaxID=39694 RepID=A0A6N4VA99_9MYCO|nr:hypothetical protein MPOR_19740 [Mycolicibacterium poriferae]
MSLSHPKDQIGSRESTGSEPTGSKPGCVAAQLFKDQRSLMVDRLTNQSTRSCARRADPGDVALRGISECQAFGGR